MHEWTCIAAWRGSVAYRRHRLGRIVSGRDGDPAGARSVSHDGDPLWDHRDHLRRLAPTRGGATSAENGGTRTAGCAVGYGRRRTVRADAASHHAAVRSGNRI